MNIDEVIKELRSRNQPVPKPMRLPTEEEVKTIEKSLGVSFHPDYKKYLLLASDVILGTVEPAQITIPNSHNHLLTVIEDAKAYELPQGLLPICEDNGAFYCIDEDGRIRFWGVEYGGFNGESWPTLADWIEKIWIGESA